MKRRKFLRNTLLGTLGATLLTGAYAWQVEPFWLEFVKKRMPIKDLPKHLNGLTLMQISDMHVGTKFDWQYIIDSFKKAKKLKPDFVVYTGDYTTYEGPEQIKQLKEVLKHKVMGRLGTVGILGNHDYGEGWKDKKLAERLTKLLTKEGIQILRNEQTEVNGLNFIGFDDYWGANFKPEKVMTQLDKSKTNLVLCHNPDVCDLDVWQGYQGWILSGHTHGGQLKPPFLKSPFLPVKNKRYSSGEIDLYDGRTLYINRALGHLVQLRFNVRPEITLFKLETA